MNQLTADIYQSQKEFANENGMELALMECDEEGTPAKFHIPQLRDEYGGPPWKAPCGKLTGLSSPTPIDGDPISKWCDGCLRYAIRETSEGAGQ